MAHNVASDRPEMALMSAPVALDRLAAPEARHAPPLGALPRSVGGKIRSIHRREPTIDHLRTLTATITANPAARGVAARIGRVTTARQTAASAA
jgi:hypothetical protein